MSAPIHRPLPLWADDWITSQAVSVMSLDQQGAYIRLLCFCWLDRDCGVLKHCFRLLSGITPYNDQDCAGRLDELEQQFVQHPSVDDKITHPKLYQLHLDDLEYREKKRVAGSFGGKSKGQAEGKQRASKGQAEGKLPSPSPSPSPSFSLSSEERKKAKAKGEKKDGATQEQIALCRAYESEMAQKRRLSVGCSPTPRNLGYLACVSLGREHAEALEVVRGYVRLEESYLVSRGWPLQLLEANIVAAVREAGKLRAAAEAEASLAALDAEEEDRQARRAAQTPEERAAEEAQTQKMLADWRAMGSRRVS